MTAADRDRQVFKEVVRSEEHKEVLLGPSHPHTHQEQSRGIYSWGSWLRRVFSASRFS